MFDDNLRLRSSLSNDFNGDTFIRDGRGRLLDVAPESSLPLLLGSCFIGISEIDGVIASSQPPILLENYLEDGGEAVVKTGGIF